MALVSLALHFDSNGCCKNNFKDILVALELLIPSLFTFLIFVFLL